MTVLLAAGCAEPEGPIGAGVGGGPVGRLESVVCLVTTNTSYRPTGVGTGGSAHLYVGQAHNITSFALARFNRPVKPFEMRVDSARFEVGFEGGIGGDATPDVEGRLAIFPWKESAAPEDGDVPTGKLLDGQTQIIHADTGRMSFALPAAEVTSWLGWVDSSLIDTTWEDPQRPDSSLTLLLKAPTASDRLIRFRSRSAATDSLHPVLLIFAKVRKDSTEALHDSTLRVPASDDLFLATDAGSLAARRLALGGGAAIRSALRFDLSSLWRLQDSLHIRVNRAVVTLTRDRSLYDWAPQTQFVRPYRMSDTLWLSRPDSANYLSFASKATEVADSTDTLQIVVSAPAVEWTASDATNFGLLLVSETEGLDLDRIAFYDSSDAVRRPRLTVYYTELPR